MGERIFADTIIDRQLALEHRAVDSGVIRYRKLAAQAIKRGEGATLKPAERLAVAWYWPLVAAIREERGLCRRGKPGVQRGVYGPALELVDPERTAVVTLHEILGLLILNPTGCKMTNLAYAVGRAYFAEANMDALRKLSHDERAQRRADRELLGEDYEWSQTTLEQLERSYKTLRPQIVNRWGRKMLDGERCIDPHKWTRRVTGSLGGALMWMLLGVASCDNDTFVPAFKHYKRFEQRGRRQITIGHFRLTDDALGMIEEGHRARQFIRPRHRPMIMKPFDWKCDEQGRIVQRGGYIAHKHAFMIKATPDQRAALEQADLRRVVAGVNAVNDQPLSIYRRMMDQILDFYRDGGGLGRIPLYHDIPYPPKVDSDDEKLIRANKLERKKTYTKNIQMMAQRETFNYTLQIAQECADEERFYLPHYLDFRGRGYPAPAMLSHHGDDVSRAMIQFAEAKPLDSRGEWWLKVNAASMYGINKVSFDARVQWAESMMDDMLRAARDPEGTVDFWAIKPDGKPRKGAFQFLSLCMAFDDPDHAARVAGRTDGTCNGMQHYVAMARDERTAPLVNLAPTEEPNSLYTVVTERAQRMLQDYIANGTPKQKKMAKAVQPYCVVDVNKTPIMTDTYGVTAIGASRQIKAGMEKLGYSDTDCYQASFFLQQVVKDSLEDTVQGAAAIKEWLEEYANIVTAHGDPVAWPTPIGLPVTLPYRQYGTADIITVMQRLTVRKINGDEPILKKKQRTSFPAHTVHGIDASHMWMTATTCHAEDVAFLGCHDAYMSHLTTMDQLGVITRDEFVNLHGEPILEQMAESFRRRYPDDEFPDPPARGRFDINDVRDSPYFFSP